MAVSQQPLIDVLGASWRLGAKVVGAAWNTDGKLAGFGLADGAVAIARARWEGGPSVARRPEGGIEVTLATAPRPAVSRAQAHKGACNALVADPAGGFLSGGADGKRVRIAADGTTHPRPEFGGRSIDRVAAGRAGWIAFAAGEEVRTTGPAAQHLAAPGPVRALVFDAVGHRLAILHPDGVWVVNDESTEVLKIATGVSPISAAWSHDGAWLALGLESGEMRAWHGNSETKLAPCPGTPLSIAVSADGRFLAGSGGAQPAIWSFAPPTETPPSACGLSSSRHLVSMVAWHPRLTVLAAGYGHGAVVLCQPGSDEALIAKPGGGGAVSALAFSPEGDLLAIGTEEGEAGIVLFPEGLLRQPGGAEALAHSQESSQ